ILVLIMFGEDIVRFFVALYNKFLVADGGFHMPSRRKFLSIIGLSIAAIPFTSLLYGMYAGKYKFRVIKHRLAFDDLPDEFDGYPIAQISDIHSGSFGGKKEIGNAIDLINEQKADTIFFTGDLVNNSASEMDYWKEVFGSINAQDGVFSVLGNHDYGDYREWESAEAKEKNLEDLKEVHKKMGWDLLLNEHRFIEKN